MNFRRLVVAVSIWVGLLSTVAVRGDQSSERLLLEASRVGRIEDVASLLRQKVNPNVGDDLGNLPLILACRFDHVQIASLLLDAGAEKNAKDGTGQTALMWAVLNGHVAVTELLVTRGVNVDEVDYRGGTALTYARQGAGKGAAIVKILEAHSGEHGWKDEKGQSVPFLILFGVIGGLLLSILEHVESANGRRRPQHWFLYVFAWLIVPAIGALLVVAFVLTGALLTPVLAIGVGLSGPALVRAWRKKPLTTSTGDLSLPAGAKP